MGTECRESHYGEEVQYLGHKIAIRNKCQELVVPGRPQAGRYDISGHFLHTRVRMDTNIGTWQILSSPGLHHVYNIIHTEECNTHTHTHTHTYFISDRSGKWSAWCRMILASNVTALSLSVASPVSSVGGGACAGGGACSASGKSYIILVYSVFPQHLTDLPGLADQVPSLLKQGTSPAVCEWLVFLSPQPLLYTQDTTHYNTTVTSITFYKPTMPP